MIRFTYQGADTDRACSPVAYAIGPEAASVAGWPSYTTIDVKQTSATTWTVTAQGEIITAEVIP
mgnify:CR=1 FL=1